MSTIQIAIDGPAGAGKSSISKRVADALGFVYIDTGAMYRAAALFAIEQGIDIKTQPQLLIEALDRIQIEFHPGAEGQSVYLNGKDVSERIREADVSIGSSDVAVLPEVRIFLVKLQRELAVKQNVIMDGRDIGTYVLPDAQLKIFLTASVEERARRRCRQLEESGKACDFEQIVQDIAYRDQNDSQRSFAPLRQAEDAVLIDTTSLSFEESVKKIKQLIESIQNKGEDV